MPEIKAITEVAADMFRRIGLNLDYQVADWGTVVQRRAGRHRRRKAAGISAHSGFGGLDMASPAVEPRAARQHGKDAWFGWPDDPKLEALRDAPGSTRRTSRPRSEFATRSNSQVFQDVPYIPLGLIKRATAFRSDLVDMVKGGIMFTNVRRA